MTEKVKCPKCGKMKDRDAFGANRCNKNGLQGWCKPCMMKYRGGKFYANREIAKMDIFDEHANDESEEFPFSYD